MAGTAEENRARMRAALDRKGFRPPPPPQGIQRVPGDDRAWRQVSPTRWVNETQRERDEMAFLAYPFQGFSPQNLGRAAMQGISRVGEGVARGVYEIDRAVSEDWERQRMMAGRRRELDALRREYEATRARMNDAERRLDRFDSGASFNDLEQRFADDWGDYAYRLPEDPVTPLINKLYPSYEPPSGGEPGLPFRPDGRLYSATTGRPVEDLSDDELLAVLRMGRR